MEGVQSYHEQVMVCTTSTRTVIPSISHASTTSEWQGGFARFAGSSQMVPPMRTEDGSSQFLPGHAAFSGVPQVNMPMFPTGMNDQWHGAFTYNTSSYIMCFIFDDLYIAILN